VVRSFFGLAGAALVTADISAGAGTAATTGGGGKGVTGAATLALVSCPRESTGAASKKQTTEFKIVLFILNFVLITLLCNLLNPKSPGG
jgi:hypothetical protein